jgi:hypothetical protein
MLSATRALTNERQLSQEIVDMRRLQTYKHSLRHGSSACRIADPQRIEPSPQAGLVHTASRHDPQMLTPRAVSADPYAAWLERREAEREREAHRLNPRAAWDALRTQSVCAVGRR